MTKLLIKDSRNPVRIVFYFPNTYQKSEEKLVIEHLEAPKLHYGFSICFADRLGRGQFLIKL